MQIDPVKEAEAAEKRLGIRVSTLAQETMALNAGLWTDNLKQQAKERAAAVKAGLITSTTQVGPPMQRETITTAEETIPDSTGEPGQKPAGQPGGAPGGAPSSPKAPQTPGKGAAPKPANPPPAAPAPVKKAAQETTDVESSASAQGETATDAKAKPGKGSPPSGDPAPDPAQDLEDEEEDENEGDGDEEDERS
jgi:hypothetical protein